jgi:hypothetical protein
MDSRVIDVPTPQEIAPARAKFEERESRDSFYRAATEHVALALRKRAKLTLSETLAVLLQTWNRPFYQYRRFDAKHFAYLDQTLRANLDGVLRYRGQQQNLPAGQYGTKR